MDEHFDEQIVHYVNGALEPEEQDRLEAHLAVCDVCRAALHEWRVIATATKSHAQKHAITLPPMLPVEKYRQNGTYIHQEKSGMETTLELSMVREHSRRGGRSVMLVATMTVVIALVMVILLGRVPDSETLSGNLFQQDVTPTVAASDAAVGQNMIVVARRPITRGSIITAPLVELWHWESNYPIAGTDDLSDVVGKIARTDMYPYQPVLTTMVTEDRSEVARVDESLVPVSDPPQRSQSVAIAARDIEVGEVIPQTGIRLERWQLAAVPLGAVSDFFAIPGMRARTDIYAGQPILTSMVAGEPYPITDEVWMQFMPPGRTGHAIPLDLSGEDIQPGEIVDVWDMDSSAIIIEEVTAAYIGLLPPEEGRYNGEIIMLGLLSGEMGILQEAMASGTSLAVWLHPDENAIVVATEHIPRGTVITEDMVEVQVWSETDLPSNRIANPAAIVGKLARTDMYPYQPVLASLVTGDRSELARVDENMEPVSDPPGNLQLVAVAMEDISAGETILRGDIGLEEWPLAAVPLGAVSDIYTIPGMQARTDVFAGQPVLTSMVSGERYAVDYESFAQLIPRGGTYVTIPLDQLDWRTMAGDAIQPGDAVDVVDAESSIIIVEEATVLHIGFLPPEEHGYDGEAILLGMTQDDYRVWMDAMVGNPPLDIQLRTVERAVVVATGPIPQGTVITEDMVEMQVGPLYMNTILDIEEVIGKVVRTDIFPNQPILISMVATPLPANTVAVAIPSNRALIPGDGIQPGDRFSIIAIMQYVDIEDEYQQPLFVDITPLDEAQLTMQVIVEDALIVEIGSYPSVDETVNAQPGLTGEVITMAVPRDDAIVLTYVLEAEMPLVFLPCGDEECTLSIAPHNTVLTEQTPVPFELGGHVAWFDPKAVEVMQQAGMTWAKVQLCFNVGDSVDDVAAGAIKEAHDAGIKVLITITGDPDEMSDFDSYIDQYVDFVGQVAGLGADAIEVWTEANIDRAWPTGQIHGENYTRLLFAAYDQIKSVNPDVMVISGALAPTGAESAFPGSVVNDDNFLQQMAEAGAADYMDCLGLHYNEGVVPPYATTGDPRDDYATRYFDTMLARGSLNFPNTPVCWTELGYLSAEGLEAQLPTMFSWANDVTVAQQATWLADAAIRSAQSERVRLMVIWNVNFEETEVDPMGRYAIMRPDGSCAACDQLGAVMRALASMIER